MPEMIPVGDQNYIPNPQQGLQSLSGILGIQQQRQNLQTGAIQQATAAAESQQAQQKNRELQAAQALVFNGAKSGQFTNPDGTLNRQKMADGISTVAPTYGPQLSTQLLSQANEVVQNQQAHQNLSATQQQQMGNSFLGLAGKPDLSNSDVIDAVGALRTNNHDPQFSRMLDSMLTHLPPNASPAQLQQLMATWGSSATGQSQVEPGTVNTGAAIIPTVGNKFTGTTAIGGGGPRAAMQLSPAQRLPQPVTNAAGQIINREPITGALSGAPVGAKPGTGGASGATPVNPTTAQASVQNTAAAATGGNDAARYAQISDAGTAAQKGVALADQVSNLADQVRTGKLTGEWANRLAVLQQHDPSITARQMLGKYAAQLQTTALANAPTDSARAQIEAGMPNPETMDPDAIKEASQYMRGNFRLSQARQSVADQYVHDVGGQPVGVRAIDDKFMQHADPFVFAYHDLPAGDARKQFLLNKFGDGKTIKNPAAVKQLIQNHSAIDSYGGFQ